MKKTRPFAALLGLALASGSALASSDAVNINKADVDELQRLDGVGPATAEAIVEHRRANGPFQRIETMTRVNGIGEATLEAVREQVTLE